MKVHAVTVNLKETIHPKKFTPPKKFSRVKSRSPRNFSEASQLNSIETFISTTEAERDLF